MTVAGRIDFIRFRMCDEKNHSWNKKKTLAVHLARVFPT
jgi:hypothetical protein